jgi:superfamily II DNA/RNA helicase
VEESEETEAQSATEGFEELRAGAFQGFECCLLHGQMPAERKREAMEAFRSGRCPAMIATTVVEVGIDVPEATVMVIQHAERLGLAQLHQLRGRIGRGDRPGHCYLLAEPTTEGARRRLTVLTETGDGFKIAEEDLRIRGPGQFFGTAQSGMPEFKCYDFSDTRPLAEARRDAFALVSRDPGLQKPQHALLREAVLRQYMGGTPEEELELRAIMKFRAAMLMVMDLVNIQKGDAEADAKRMIPILSLMKETREEQDAAAARAKASSEEIADRAAYETANQLSQVISQNNTRITDSINQIRQAMGGKEDNNPLAQVLNSMQSMQQMMQMFGVVMPGMQGMSGQVPGTPQETQYHDIKRHKLEETEEKNV